MKQNQNLIIFPIHNPSSALKDMSAVDLMELFIDNDVIEFLVEESNKYAMHIHCTDPKITDYEIRCFLAILIVSGYNSVPSRRFFWDSKEYARNLLIYKAVRRDRFEQIMRFVHFLLIIFNLKGGSIRMRA